MRIRETDNRGDLVLKRYVTGSTTSTTTRTRSGYTGWQKRTADIVVPRFNQRSRKGETFFNPYESREVSRFFAGGDCGYTKELSGTDYVSEYVGDALWYYSNTDPAPVLHHIDGHRLGSTLRKESFTRAKAGVNSATFQGMTELGELRETIQFLKSPLRSLNSYLRKNRKRVKKDYRREQRILAARRKRLAKLSRYERAKAWARSSGFYSHELDILSDAWLASRYAVRPLIGSCVDASSAIDKSRLKTMAVRETSRGFASQSKTLSSDDGRVGSVGYFNLYGTRQTEINTSVRSGVMFRPLSKNTWGMKHHEVLPAMYELTPYSFIADWFANTNAYLRALTPRTDVKVLGQWTVTDYDIVTTREITAVKTNPGSIYHIRGNPGGYERFHTKGKVRRIGDQSGWTLYHSFDLGIDQVTDLLAIGRGFIT
mgnify:CR=1 FL=1